MLHLAAKAPLANLAEQGGKDPPDLRLLDITYINDIAGVRVYDHITPAGVHGN